MTQALLAKLGRRQVGMFADGDSGSKWKIQIRVPVFLTPGLLPFQAQLADLPSGGHGFPSDARSLRSHHCLRL